MSGYLERVCQAHVRMLDAVLHKVGDVFRAVDDGVVVVALHHPVRHIREVVWNVPQAVVRHDFPREALAVREEAYPQQSARITTRLPICAERPQSRFSLPRTVKEI